MQKYLTQPEYVNLVLARFKTQIPTLKPRLNVAHLAIVLGQLSRRLNSTDAALDILLEAWHRGQGGLRASCLVACIGYWELMRTDEEAVVTRGLITNGASIIPALSDSTTGNAEKDNLEIAKVVASTSETAYALSQPNFLEGTTLFEIALAVEVVLELMTTTNADPEAVRDLRYVHHAAKYAAFVSEKAKYAKENKTQTYSVNLADLGL